MRFFDFQKFLFAFRGTLTDFRDFFRLLETFSEIEPEMEPDTDPEPEPETENDPDPDTKTLPPPPARKKYQKVSKVSEVS